MKKNSKLKSHDLKLNRGFFVKFKVKFWYNKVEIKLTFHTMQTFMTLGIKKKLRSEKFLEEIDKVIPWDKLIKAINKKKKIKETEVGRKQYDTKIMLQIYFMQQWYNLSDPAMEDAIYDRLSFQKFLEIDLMGDNVPDETTILNFRHFLEKNDLQKKFLEIINNVLKKNQLLLQEGTIVDASIIKASSSTKNKDKKRDEEMSSTRKNNNYFFGMKTHIGVDGKSGLVHTLEVTSAKVSDKKMMEDLLHGKEKYVSGDKGYIDKSMKKDYRKNGKIWLVLDKGTVRRKLSTSQKKKNQKLSSLRSKVEHPFQVVKHLWGHRKVKYKGLKKNTMHFFALFALSNLYKIRKKQLIF